MRVALVHDWLTGMRGGERVLEEMCRLFPDAALFTLFHRPGSVSQTIESMPIRTSFLNRVPGIHRRYRNLLPMYPMAVSTFDLSGFDLVLSSSHAVAKAARKAKGALHICYCHTPMRYVWDMKSDYFHYSDPLRVGRLGLALTAPALRAWDRRTARRVDHFIANSRHVRDRIARCYRRDAEVVYPPVDTTFFEPSHNGRVHSYYLIVSALVPPKRLDLAIQAFNRMGRPLIVVGCGPDLSWLRRRAADNIEFKGFVGDATLKELYQHCKCLVIPGREDLGLTALEAQACGRPVVAYAAGGSLETVSHNETGVLFERQTARDLEEAILQLDSLHLEPERARARAEEFSAERFRVSLKRAIEDSLNHRTTEKVYSLNSRVVEEKPEEARACADDRRSNLSTDAAVTLTHPSLRGPGGLAKRCLDVALSVPLLIVLAPVLLALAWIIRRETSGPGFFFQTRLGLGGRPFVMVKLRTMKSRAEKEGEPIWAVNRDPRCTRTGNYLRRCGIDELPQVWNILKGEMSFVGPRPERPEFHREFVRRFPEFQRRLGVRGGLTGLAQIRGWRGDTSIEERLRTDLEYLETWSFWNDLRIMLRTPIVIYRTLQAPQATMTKSVPPARVWNPRDERLLAAYDPDIQPRTTRDSDVGKIGGTFDEAG